MTVNPYIPPLRLENLYIHNERILPSREKGILESRLDDQKEIILQYNQTNFMIEYSALNYIFPDRNQYAYMLEGFDSGWNEVDNRRTAYYTNVPPGKYRFLVRGSNNDELWNLEGTSLMIRVLPPLWKTWWAYLLYVVTLLGIGWIILRYYLERKRLENEVKLKQAEVRAREEFRQERNKLFTHFSHELRTPLTLIVSPLEEIVQKADEFSDKIRHSHRLMYNNSLRLLRLVNNLMDFQKKESGMLQLKVTEDNYTAFSSEMCSLFTDLAESRRISLELHASHPEIPYWFDRSLMEKVWFNFLSNAFKNVPDEGRIGITVEKGTLQELASKVPVIRLSGFTDSTIDYILLDVTDSGAGIPEEELEKIFAPFYQVAQNEHSVSGTGLGLSLSKSIIEMHHGVVWAESGPGRGASFRSLLPVNKELFSPEELFDSWQYQEQPALQVESKEEAAGSEKKGKKIIRY
ncbi:MAG: ATP-binding protein [Bacteroides sp.]|nr:ATP-binding protein [Bacteroides sp.]